MFLLSLSTHPQDVNHQSEIIKNNTSKCDYKIVADQYKSYSGIMEITDIKYDINQPNEHFEIVLKEYPNHATESNRIQTSQYFPDNIAFPVTYVNSIYEGNARRKKPWVMSLEKEEALVLIESYL